MSDATPKTKPKLLVLLGAGSSKDMEMPMMDGLGRSLLGVSARWTLCMNKHSRHTRPDYFKLVWENRVQAARHAANDLHAEQVGPNYERCLGDLHALMNGTLPLLYGAKPSRDVCRALVLGLRVDGLNRSKRDVFMEIQALLQRLLESLTGDFRRRCLAYKSEILTTRAGGFGRYRGFLSALRARFDLGVYNLNHDTVALTALENCYTGFEKTTGSFEAAKVQCRSEWDFLYHLHGSVHFSLGRLSAHELHAPEHSPDMCWIAALDDQAFRDEASLNTATDDRWVIASTLVAGGWKLDQLQVEPFQTFYSTLPRHAHEADAVLIAGYGFGDEHVNSVLANMLKACEGRRPPVMVLDFRTMEARPLEGERRKGLEFVEREDSWQSGVRTSLNTWKHAFQRAKGLDQPLVESEYGELVRSDEYAVCFDPAYPVAVWFGGFLAAAERKDEIADWLLRHVPSR